MKKTFTMLATCLAISASATPVSASVVIQPFQMIPQPSMITPAAPQAQPSMITPELTSSTRSTEFLVGLDILGIYQAVNAYHTSPENVPKLGQQHKKIDNSKLISRLEEMELQTKEAEQIRDATIKKLETRKVTDALSYLEDYSKKFSETTELEDTFKDIVSNLLPTTSTQPQPALVPYTANSSTSNTTPPQSTNFFDSISNFFTNFFSFFGFN